MTATYNLWAVNDKTHKRYLLTSEPCTLRQAQTIKSKHDAGARPVRFLIEPFTPANA